MATRGERKEEMHYKKSKRKLGVRTSRVGHNRIYAPYMTVFGDFPADNIVYTPHIYGSGQPYL
jgi:hypothetical protein